MKSVHIHFPAVAAVLLLPLSAPADPLESVLVLGTRNSLQSAIERKRDNDDIVDGVVAAEIHKLADLSVADAVQRITGVQIARDRGEASVAAVRGLIQIETTLNGREVFTAGFGRALDYADLPSEFLAGIDVYKTSSATRIEGGLGGLVDLRTRQPFDFRDATLALSARLMHGDLASKNAGQFSALFSRRASIGSGEIGVLLNLALQDRAWREDSKATGTPMVCSARSASGCNFDLIAGQDIVAPSSTSESTSFGRRRRSAASLMLGWRPRSTTEIYAEAHFAEMRTTQDTQQINVGPNFSAGSGFDPASVALYDGTNDVRHVSWTNAPISVLSFARDTIDRTRQLAAGARWSNAPLHLDAELSHTRSFNRLFFSGTTLAANAALFTQDLSGAAPGTAIAGTDLADPASYRYAQLNYRVRPLRGSLLAARVDGEWQIDSGAFDQVSFGWRRARRDAGNAPNLIFGDVAVPGAVSAAGMAGRTRAYPYSPFLDGRTASLTGYLIDTLADARDPVALRQAFGITTPLPTAGSPLGVWRIREQTDAVYAQAGWHVPARALDGQFGLRAVHTRSNVEGNQQVPSTAAIEPIEIGTTTTDWLPSASLRWRPGGPLQWRAAVSRTITRPDFNQLSPSITLTPNSVNPQLNQGVAGNPLLRPLRAANADVAAEVDFGRGHAASLTGFWKRVDGFIATQTQAEEHDGASYQVSRPYNADAGHIRGLELSYQRFLDFLPGAWRGLGLLVNATYVDSSTYDRVLRAHVPMQNLSRTSVNLVALYERDHWSGRLAWNWRSRFASQSTSVVGLGAFQAYTQAYGWLDASLRWQLSDHLSWSLECGNLLKTMRRSYFGVETRPAGAWVNDRQIGTSVSVQI